MDKIDILLEKNTQGLYDIQFENGDLKSDDSFDTSINITLFTDRRADESEQPNAEYRRGWWGNLFSSVEDFEIGSKLWLLDQERATDNTLYNGVSHLQNAFQWYVDDGHLQEVQVSGVLGQSNIDFKVDLIRSNNVVASKNFKLWDNTGR